MNLTNIENDIFPFTLRTNTVSYIVESTIWLNKLAGKFMQFLRPICVDHYILLLKTCIEPFATETPCLWYALFQVRLVPALLPGIKYKIGIV